MARKARTALPRPIAMVVWDDAFYTSDVFTEQQLREIKPACRLYSTGFVAHETDDYVVLAMDFSDDQTYRHVQSIRKENIRDIVYLK